MISVSLALEKYYQPAQSSSSTKVSEVVETLFPKLLMTSILRSPRDVQLSFWLLEETTPTQSVGLNNSRDDVNAIQFKIRIDHLYQSLHSLGTGGVLSVEAWGMWLGKVMIVAVDDCKRGPTIDYIKRGQLQSPLQFMNTILTRTQARDDPTMPSIPMNKTQSTSISHQNQSILHKNSQRSLQDSKQQTTSIDTLQARQSNLPGENSNQVPIRKEEDQKPNFQLDDESIDLTPLAQLQVQVSDISQEDLFTTKINLAQAEIGSPIVESLSLQFRPTNSSVSSPSRLREWYAAQEMSLVEKSVIRRQKVQRYRQKKMNRSFRKRVSYHSRKTVAESRLRVKGRFVTKSQAEGILRIDLSCVCNKGIKVLLQRHYSSV